MSDRKPTGSAAKDRARELQPAAEAARALLEELRLMPLGVASSEAYGIVERWKDDEGHIKYGRDLAEWIGAEGDETARRFTELVVLAVNMLPSLLAVLDERGGVTPRPQDRPTAANSRDGMVAALFVEKGGVYYGLPDVDPWDAERDARLYAGPWPVVAHPPCTRWCRFAKQVEQRHGYRVGDDGGTFEAALTAVRAYGGVLEHPADSLAWNAYGLPKPVTFAGWTSSLDDAGASCYVEQGRYGLPMRKATWLYAYGVELPQLRWGRRIDSEGGAFKWGSYLYKGAPNKDRPRLPAAILAQTPLAFRDVLLGIARSSARVEVAA